MAESASSIGIPVLGLFQTTLMYGHGAEKMEQNFELSSLEKSSLSETGGNVHWEHGNMTENLDPDKPSFSLSKGGEVSADDYKNRSPNSQRTVIEAGDFGSFLAQDDENEADNCKDEDSNVSEGEDGSVDLSALMKRGSNPYMLDFTSDIGADSEEEDDGIGSGSLTFSASEDVSQGEGTNFQQMNSIQTTEDTHTSGNKGRTEEDEETESPPRNLRAEINNNMNKYFRMNHDLFTPSLDIINNFDPDIGIGPPGLTQHFTSLSPGVHFSKSQNFLPGNQGIIAGPNELPHEFDTNSQNCPKTVRSYLGNDISHDYSQNFAGCSDGSLANPVSEVCRQQYISGDCNNISGLDDRSLSYSSAHSQTPLGSSVFISTSMENLCTGHNITGGPFVSAPLISDNCVDKCFQDSSPRRLRGTSLPNIAHLFTGASPDLCKNCAFSRNDYLFKIRLLQTQLEKTEKELKRKEKQWTSDLRELKKENERQQKVISQSLTLGPEARIEATMQHEITRLTSENLDLRESIDKQTDQIRKLKKMLKVYARKLKDGEAAEIAAELENEESASTTDSIATVIHRERSYMGMLEYKKDDETALIKNLILDLKPKLSTGLIPGLPAYILFMCVRHTDYINDDEKVKSLLTSTINGIKKVVKRHSDDLERITLWLANTCRLLHTLKQYSGEKQFQTENTSKQNEQSLRNFDLSEYRQVFSDLAVWNYQALMKLMEELMQPTIVPAILEHEAIAGLTASKPSGLRGRSSSNARDLEDGKDSQHSLDVLIRTLNSFMRIVKQHAVDPELVKQIFRQLFYFLCAGALNNLLLRKDMCNWSKGMQIRYNLSHLEQWLRDNSLHEFGAQAALEPIIQASQLLQARKTDSDVDSICDMCSKLTTAQIVKILNIYTPVDEFEERVPIAFIRKIQAKLKKREEQGMANNTLLMDTKYSYPVTFPFNPSSVALETISVPEQLHIGFLIRH